MSPLWNQEPAVAPNSSWLSLGPYVNLCLRVGGRCMCEMNLTSTSFIVGFLFAFFFSSSLLSYVSSPLCLYKEVYVRVNVYECLHTGSLLLMIALAISLWGSPSGWQIHTSVISLLFSTKSIVSPHFLLDVWDCVSAVAFQAVNSSSWTQRNVNLKARLCNCYWTLVTVVTTCDDIMMVSATVKCRIDRTRRVIKSANWLSNGCYSTISFKVCQH